MQYHQGPILVNARIQVNGRWYKGAQTKRKQILFTNSLCLSASLSLYIYRLMYKKAEFAAVVFKASFDQRLSRIGGWGLGFRIFGV